MSLRYRCLILDHDDTSVESTRYIQFPSFYRAIKRTRPELEMDFEEYMAITFDEGPVPSYYSKLHLTQEEFDNQHEDWVRDCADATPDFFPGIPELLTRFRAEGGIVVIDSGSHTPTIVRAYDKAGLPHPDRVYGGELPLGKRKPSAYIIESILNDFNLTPSDCFLIDDGHPGIHMAMDAGIEHAGALWARPGAYVEARLRELGPCFETVAELERKLFL